MSLAACSPSAGNPTTTSPASTTSGVTTSTTASTTTTSSTLPASAVAIVSAPVRVAHTPQGAVGYRVVGAGPPLLLLMGYSGSLDAWDPTFVDALGRAHRVFTIDNAGVGRSSLVRPFSIVAMANQAAAFIGTMHLGRPDVLGWSMGGMIAQALAVLHPSLVRDLVLCATLPGNGKATGPSPQATAALANPSDVSGVLATLYPPNQKKALDEYLSGLAEYPHLYLATPAVDRLQLGTLGSWVGGDIAAGRDVASIAAPTLVADGLDDVLVPVANDRELASVIPRARLVLYPDAGHAFLFQDERSFLGVLERFLGD